MKTLQLKSISLLLMLGLVVFASCKKDNPPSAESLAGRWSGKYGQGNQDNSFTFNLLEGGALQYIGVNNTVTATGTWEVNGSQVLAIYNFNVNATYKFKGNYNKLTKKITGVTGEDDDYNSTFFLERE